MIQTRELFARRGLRCTKQRIDIYEALAACRSHPTAEELHNLVHPGSPGLSLATVYNTLEALASAGLCQKIMTSCGGARYDADVEDHLHVVLDDGRVLDVPGELAREVLDAIPESSLRRISRAIGMPIAGVSIQLVAAPTRAASQR